MIDIGWPDRRANPADIATYLAVDATALSILKVINQAPDQDWTISLTFDVDLRLCVDVKPPECISPTGLLDGTCPELFWCSEMIVTTQSTVVKSANPPLNSDIESFVNVGEVPNGIKLIEYRNSSHLAPEFSDVGKLHDFLRDETWMGSARYAKSKATLTIDILAQRKEIVPRDLLPAFAPQDYFSREIIVGSSRVEIKFPTSSTVPAVRIDRLGLLNDVEPVAPIVQALRCDVLKGFEVELQGDWPYEVGPLGAPFQTERIGDKIDEFIEKIKQDSKLNAIIDTLRKQETKRQAAHLNARLAAARASPLVYWNRRILGCVPTSEQGTVAVIHKLEGMNALPLNRYDSQAWAGHEGIDAIVDLQFTADESVMFYSPVEYEYLFENFINHGHPIQHVKLIVCWDDRDDPRLHSGSKEWMPSYRFGQYEVPVLVIKKIPGITIQNNKELH